MTIKKKSSSRNLVVKVLVQHEDFKYGFFLDDFSIFHKKMSSSKFKESGGDLINFFF